MKTKYIKSILGLGVILLSNNALADNVTAGSKATASLVASCQIKAQSVSFGALALPISSQSATGNLDVLCNKEAAYKIDLTYGISSNYWTFGPWGGRWDSSKLYYEMTEYDSSGKALRVQRYNTSKQVPTETLVAAVGCKYLDDGKCHSLASSTSTGSVGNGNMSGIKGDTIAYNIYLPEDSSKVWNIGQNAYTGTGTGVSQNIPVKAKIVPGSSTAYPTPDMYTDTVTATITY